MSEQINEVAKALAAAKAKFKPAVRDATNPHFNSKFVSLAGVLDAVDAALSGAGLALVQQTDLAEDGAMVLHSRLFHESGQWLGSVYPIRPVKNDPQGVGSAITYARRYASMALLGIAAEDDDGDGEAASQPASNGNGRGQQRRQQSNAAPSTNELLARIANVGGQRNLSRQEIADDFAGWSQGLVIREADAESLGKYLAHLDKQPTP